MVDFRENSTTSKDSLTEWISYICVAACDRKLGRRLRLGREEYEMEKFANAFVQTVSNGFPRFIWVGWMLLFAALGSMAQPASNNIWPTSIRDRLFQPKIGTPPQQANSSAFAGAIDGTAKLNREFASQLAEPNRGITVPYWSDSYSYLGLTYSYSMVGTDPKRGSATTIVPTVIIPMRFVFENGLVYDAAADSIDGQTSVQGMINSPVFQNYDFISGGTHVGNTQYADAFQRANFWNSVSRRSPDYHVLLGQPTLAPSFEVFVPNDLVTFYAEGNGQLFAKIDEDFLQQATWDALDRSNISPQKLAIVAWGDVSGTLASGYHRTRAVPGGTLTYIATGYHSRIPFFRFQDAAVFSHEAIEWLDDPFELSNFTPGWNPVSVEYPTCLSQITADELEVGDVFEFTPAGFIALNTANGVYHVQEGAFLDYFTRNLTSRSVNGQYSFFGVANGPSADCVGHLEIQPTTLLEFPNSVATVATGINDLGQIVGVYIDQTDNVHGFIYERGRYTQLDYPGAIETDLNGINNWRQISGYYLDTAGLPHGFVYFLGKFFPVNFPGAIDTAAIGINSHGDVVGGYDDASATHGFVFQNARFRTVDAPFGSQTQVLSINNFGNMAGYTWSDPNGQFGGFILDRSGFRRFDFPAALDTFPNAINDDGDHGGTFYEYDIFYGTVDGFGYVTINGRPYTLYYYVLGMNNQNQIVGNAFNFITNRRVGFVATLPGH